MYNWFRGFIQGKTRIVTAWIFAALLVFSAREYPSLPGILICFAGATLRFWASGYLRKDNRPAVGGPYAYVRNPLYLGTWLMAIGTAVAIENWWLAGTITVLFATLYHYIILDEETKLHRIFGSPYETYCSLVPRFFPRLWPANSTLLAQVNPESTHHRYDWPLALSKQNKAWEPHLTFLALMAFVCCAAWAWQHLGASALQ